MNNIIISNSVRFIFLILLQVLLLNQIDLSGYINPMLYILFVFLYPLESEKINFLIVCFFLGLIIDVFSNSGGINASATVLIAYLRLPLLHIIQNKTEFDYLLFSIKKLTLPQALVYIFSLTLIHHIVIFGLEFYKTQSIFSILSKILITTLISGILISFIIQLFLKDKRT